MAYIDACLLAVPNANKAAYIDHARRVAEVFRDYGALKLVECWGDDVPQGEVTSMPMAVKCGDDETVVLSLTTWPSREVRDAAWSKMSTDSRVAGDANPMPADGTRMIFGGFETVVDE